jgi:plastocyanin
MRPHFQRAIGGLFTGGLLCLAVLAVRPAAYAQVTVTGQVVLLNGTSGKPLSDASQVVIWLTAPSGASPKGSFQPRQELRLVQRHKSFDPHLLVVQAGSIVQFPNEDPFFHNVFSLFEGKRFDLGLYEAGSTRSVLFDKPGICYLFCNIHPEMSAVVIVLKTPYYAISDRAGQISIPEVPPGRYELDIWNQRSLVEDLKSLTRQVDIREGMHSLGTIPVRANPNQMMAHKNKYGRDYDNPTPPSSVYAQP